MKLSTVRSHSKASESRFATELAPVFTLFVTVVRATPTATAAHDGECTIINSDSGEIRKLNISTHGFRQVVARDAIIRRWREWL